MVTYAEIVSGSSVGTDAGTPKVAEDANQSLDRAELEPGDDVHDAQLYLIVTMLLKGTFMDEGRVEYDEGVAIVVIARH